MTRIMVLMVVVLAFVLLVQCSDKGSESIDSNIVGTWNWIRSTGGYSGHDVITPGTFHAPQVLHIHGDSRYVWYIADTIYQQGAYRLESRQIEPGLITKVLLLEQPSGLIDDPAYIIDYVGRDSLVVVEDCFDCFTKTYIRLRGF
jgi:hypothetical protein